MLHLDHERHTTFSMMTKCLAKKLSSTATQMYFFVLYKHLCAQNYFSRRLEAVHWHVICACRKALADWAQAAVLETGSQPVTSLDWALGRSKSEV